MRDLLRPGISQSRLGYFVQTVTAHNSHIGLIGSSGEQKSAISGQSTGCVRAHWTLDTGAGNTMGWTRMIAAAIDEPAA
jgi:hypothetical protein